VTGFAPTLSVVSPTFTAAGNGGRAGNNGTSARGAHDPVANDHSGTAATEEPAADAGTAGNAAPAFGVVSTSINAGSGTAIVPVAGSPAPALGFVSFGSDGRAVFDGSGGIVLAMGPAGAFAPGRWPGRQGPLPSTELPTRGSARGESTSAGDRTDGDGAQAPHRSDLLTDFLPYDRAALEQAIDRFLARCDDLGAELARANGPADLLTEILAVAVAITAAKVGLRLFGRPRDDESGLADADLCMDADPFPGTLEI
jgi:hypothetical protein